MGANPISSIMNEIHGFIVVDELFPRYTILVNVLDRRTSVYCDECEQWVTQWDGEQISRNTEIELLEKIVDAHRVQVLGHEIDFE